MDRTARKEGFKGGNEKDIKSVPFGIPSISEVVIFRLQVFVFLILKIRMVELIES